MDRFRLGITVTLDRHLTLGKVLDFHRGAGMELRASHTLVICSTLSYVSILAFDL